MGNAHLSANTLGNFTTNCLFSTFDRATWKAIDVSWFRESISEKYRSSSVGTWSSAETDRSQQKWSSKCCALRGCLRSRIDCKKAYTVRLSVVHFNPVRAIAQFYSSNLTHTQFDLIQPLLPPAKPGGRYRSTSLWAVLNAIFYVVTQGGKWRDIPGNFPASPWFGSWYGGWRNLSHPFSTNLLRLFQK